MSFPRTPPRSGTLLAQSRFFLLLLLLTVPQAEVFAQGYGGPSILSRGGNRPGLRGRAPQTFNVYSAVRGTAESGITPVALDDDGTVLNQTLYGIQIEGGAYGAKNWRRSSLGLDYRGDYRKTNSTSNQFNGANQAISVSYQNQLTRRLSMTLQQTGGTTNRAFGAIAAPLVSDPQGLYLVNNELFDARSYFGQSAAFFTYQASARLSYSAGAQYFAVKRSDPRLVSTTGYLISAAPSYRLNARNSVSLLYTYSNYEFKRAFSSAQIHGLLGSFSRKMSRNWDVSLGAGLMNLDVLGTRSVELSPEIAALIGRSTEREAFQSNFWAPQANVQANYTLERSRFNVSFASGVTPGNGVFLTSRANSVSVGYSYAGTRRSSWGASASYGTFGAVGLDQGQLTSFRVGGGWNYVLNRGLNLSSQFDYRTFSSGGLNGREGYSAAVGLSYSPSRFPLAIW